MGKFLGTFKVNGITAELWEATGCERIDGTHQVRREGQSNTWIDMSTAQAVIRRASGDDVPNVNVQRIVEPGSWKAAQ